MASSEMHTTRSYCILCSMTHLTTRNRVAPSSAVSETCSQNTGSVFLDRLLFCIGWYFKTALKVSAPSINLNSVFNGTCTLFDYKIATCLFYASWAVSVMKLSPCFLITEIDHSEMTEFRITLKTHNDKKSNDTVSHSKYGSKASLTLVLKRISEIKNYSLFGTLQFHAKHTFRQVCGNAQCDGLHLHIEREGETSCIRQPS